MKKGGLEQMIEREELKRRKPANYTYFECEKLDNEHKAIIVPFSDLHYGNKYCKVEELKANLDWAYKKDNVYLLLNGDMIESKTRSRKGDGIFTQLEPQDQIDHIMDMFQPFADQNRIIAMTNGNHEDAITLETGIDITSILAKQFNVPYLHNGGFVTVKVGKQLYQFYMTHGSSGSTLPHTKSRAVREMSNFIQGVDAILYGHVHAKEDATQEIYVPSMKKRGIITKTLHFILTGHYLDYVNSYAQAKSMRPSATGTPKVKLHGIEKMLRVSL